MNRLPAMPIVQSMNHLMKFILTLIVVLTACQAANAQSKREQLCWLLQRSCFAELSQTDLHLPGDCLRQLRSDSPAPNVLENAKQALLAAAADTAKQPENNDAMAAIDHALFALEHAKLMEEAMKIRLTPPNSAQELIKAFAAIDKLADFREAFPEAITAELKRLSMQSEDSCLLEWRSLFQDASPLFPVPGQWVTMVSCDGIVFRPFTPCSSAERNAAAQSRCLLVRQMMNFNAAELLNQTVQEANGSLEQEDTLYLNLAGVPRNTVVKLNGVLQTRLPVNSRHSFRITIPPESTDDCRLVIEYEAKEPRDPEFLPWLSRVKFHRRDRER